MKSGERTEEEEEEEEGKKQELICPLVDEQSPCGWRELSKAAKWIIICKLDWRQTFNEDDVNLSDMRGLRQRDWQRERWQQANILSSEMNGLHIIMAMKLPYSTGHSQPPPVRVSGCLSEFLKGQWIPLSFPVICCTWWQQSEFAENRM